MVPREHIDMAKTVPIVDVWWRGKCPSCAGSGWRVAGERGFFHCFDCKESGTVIDLYMMIHKASFHEAVRALIAIRNDRD